MDYSGDCTVKRMVTSLLQLRALYTHTENGKPHTSVFNFHTLRFVAYRFTTYRDQSSTASCVEHVELQIYALLCVIAVLHQGRHPLTLQV